MVTHEYIIDGGGDTLAMRIAAVVSIIVVGVEHLDWLALYSEELEIRTIAVSESVIEVKRGSANSYIPARKWEKNLPFWLFIKGCVTTF